MLSAATPPSATPIDQDLQALYNEVWKGFTTENVDTPSSATDVENIYNGYSESEYTSSPSTAVSPSSTRSVRSPTSNSNNGSVRRLPLPPTPVQDVQFPMPEPEPYYEPTSNGAELIRKPTDRSNRKLPAPPSTDASSIYHPNGSTSSFGRTPSYQRQPSPIPPVDVSGRNTPYDPPTSYLLSDYNNGPIAGPSTHRTDSMNSYDYDYPGSPETYEDYVLGGPTNIVRRTSDMLRDLASTSATLPPDSYILEGEFEDWTDFVDLEEDSFVNFSLLSHLGVQLRDKVPRGTHVKGSIPYNNAFTGRDVVTTIQAQIQRELALNHNLSTSDRRPALQVARSLQSQLFFYEVEWGGRVLKDGVEDVYMFLDSSSEPSGSSSEARLTDDLQELPTGVVTMLTRCYVPSCSEEEGCYSASCPRKGNIIKFFIGEDLPEGPGQSLLADKSESWINTVPKEVLERLPESEINRQTIIHKIISKEAQYISDLDIIEKMFLIPLRTADPPIISPISTLDSFIDEVFGNLLDLRECNRRLLEVMHVRQREMSYVIQRIGDVFLGAAAEFQFAYPTYVGNLPNAEKRLREEEASNMEFKVFLDQCARRTARQGEPAIRMELKTYLNRPSEHLQKYPVLLDAIFQETAVGNPDADFLQQAIEAMKGLQTAAQLRTFQGAMGKGPTGKWEWVDLVGQDVRKEIGKDEAKRQSIIFELIKGEMAYVKDLENVQNMYITPLRDAQPPIIPPERLESFIRDVFHNIVDLHLHHQRLLSNLHDIQCRQHPKIRSVTAALLDGALNFREAYMEYIPNYPIAEYRIDEEMINNPAFKEFVERCTRHPDAHRLDMKNFINRPIPRLLRYELLLKSILDETPAGHDDKREIPQVLEVIKSLGRDTEPGVVTAKQKVELWRYNSGLVFKTGEFVDLDLLDEQRSLIFSGKLLRQPDSGVDWNGWSELYVLLFDNYMVMTKPKEKDGITKYHVTRRPIPLDLLTLVNVTDPPTLRGTGLLRTLRSNTNRDGDALSASSGATTDANDSRSVFPITIHHTGRMGGSIILYAESAQSRSAWQAKLDEALGIRKVVQDNNKVFEIETLSSETFMVPSILGAPTSPPGWNGEHSFTGKVTCSVPFNTADGRGLVAIGCAEGVWIGFRHDPKSMRRVLHLKMVTQCAMLEEFGIFLVLADKSLFAYHIEALVPSSPQSVNSASQVPQKLNGNKDVHFFSVGQLHGRTLIIYMKKRGMDSIFRVLEPVGDKINERARAPTGIGTRLFRTTKSEWFRIYRDFFLPSESFDLVFLKARIAILCTKGFEIMDLNDFKSVTIPASDDPRQAPLLKRCESCHPLGMFRSTEEEFLLVYEEFGIYVDKHGDPRRQGTIEWEGKAERVALHHPYILLFDTRFIEIRHLETGRLAQIIPGNDVRCLWDGRGVGSNVVTPSYDSREEIMDQEARVHAVMNAIEPTSRSRALPQHVFELIPTVLLYVPGSMTSPERDVMYGQSYSSYSSPPHTPLARDSSWRLY